MPTPNGIRGTLWVPARFDNGVSGANGQQRIYPFGIITNVNAGVAGATTFVRNANTRYMTVRMLGAGGGGGSGVRHSTAAQRRGGGAGGGGAGMAFLEFFTAQLGTANRNVECVVGTGGAGGAAPGVTSPGNPGSDGTASVFGVWGQAGGGKGGAGGLLNDPTGVALGGDGGAGWPYDSLAGGRGGDAYGDCVTPPTAGADTMGGSGGGGAGGWQDSSDVGGASSKGGSVGGVIGSVTSTYSGPLSTIDIGGPAAAVAATSKRPNWLGSLADTTTTTPGMVTGGYGGGAGSTGGAGTAGAGALSGSNGVNTATGAGGGGGGAGQTGGGAGGSGHLGYIIVVEFF